MGISGWIARKSKSAVKAIGNSYSRFTGKATFEEADKMYNEVKTRFERHKDYFEAQVSLISAQIDNSIKSVNQSKELIKTELFPAFAQKMKCLKDIPVSDEYMKEYFSGTTIRVDGMKTKAELYLIDFHQHSIRNNALAIVSLGFYTRKKAKETIERVKEEKLRLLEEMSRMDSELTKLIHINKALELVSIYYSSLIDLYRLLLNRIDNSVNYLTMRSIIYAHKLVNEQMSIKNLPKSQQAEIMAMVSVSKILKEMVDKKISMEGDTENICINVNNIEGIISKQRESIIQKAV